MINTLLSENLKLILNNSFNAYRELIAYRHDKLFTEFLPTGYHYVTLSSVTEDYNDIAMIAKYHVGMLITLLDDFADHPLHVNLGLLNAIYKMTCQDTTIPIFFNEREKKIFQLAEYLLEMIIKPIQTFPHYDRLINILKFDLQQFYQANYLSSLMTQDHTLANTYECKQLRPFNMGMVITSMIDVMASPSFHFSDLGLARRIFHFGQRFSSISNNLTTFAREWQEGDITNEITIMGLEANLITHDDFAKLSSEQAIKILKPIFHKLESEQEEIKIILATMNPQSFSCKNYLNGIIKLQNLHQTMSHII